MLCQLFSTILFCLLIIPLAHYSQYEDQGHRCGLQCQVEYQQVREVSDTDWSLAVYCHLQSGYICISNTLAADAVCSNSVQHAQHDFPLVHKLLLSTSLHC